MHVPKNLVEALDVFEPVIGLEVHAQLRTESKLFSAAPNRYDPERPNHFITTYCIGLPGVLPVLNERAVDMAITTGLALGCTIQRQSEWSRKQYFYPDLPKGYQISQYDRPLCENGALAFEVERGTKSVRIRRVHMEEDAGKSAHVAHSPYSLVDFNRAGVPLVEIVSEPDLRSAEDAAAYLIELRSVLVALGVCDGNMEEGSFRCDANVSIRPKGSETLGTRCEVKNVNSFRFVEQAIECEILRQATAIARGEAIEQETRLFDSAKKETRSMRSKEEAHDYRYFPDPDLPPLVVDDARIERIRGELPELPSAKRARYRAFGLPEEHVLAFANEPDLGRLFDAAREHHPEATIAIANLIKGEVMRMRKEGVGALAELRITPVALASLAKLRDEGKLSSSRQKQWFSKIWSEGATIDALVATESAEIDDGAALLPIIDRVLAENPREVEKYLGGMTKVLSHFIGQVMKATAGRANPTTVRDLVVRRLEEKK